MKIQFIIRKRTYEVEYDPGESVLDSAIRQDVNPPYSCMEGVCTACLGIVKEGEVDFPNDTILDEDEVQRGRILTCQAKPKPGCEKLVIDYDAI